MASRTSAPATVDHVVLHQRSQCRTQPADPAPERPRDRTRQQLADRRPRIGADHAPPPPPARRPLRPPGLGQPPAPRPGRSAAPRPAAGPAGRRAARPESRTGLPLGRAHLPAAERPGQRQVDGRERRASARAPIPADRPRCAPVPSAQDDRARRPAPPDSTGRAAGAESRGPAAPEVARPPSPAVAAPARAGPAGRRSPASAEPPSTPKLRVRAACWPPRSAGQFRTLPSAKVIMVGAAGTSSAPIRLSSASSGRPLLRNRSRQGAGKPSTAGPSSTSTPSSSERARPPAAEPVRSLVQGHGVPRLGQTRGRRHSGQPAADHDDPLSHPA